MPVEIEPKESWFHVAAVVYNQKVSGLSALVLYCYQIEAMVAELESQTSPSSSSVENKYYALYIAWVGMFFEVLRSIFDRRGEFPHIPREKMNKIEEIKRTLAKVREYTTKLQPRNEEPLLENQEEVFSIAGGRFTREVFTNNIPGRVVSCNEDGKITREVLTYGISGRDDDDDDYIIDRREITQKFVSIFRDLQPTESGKVWLAKDREILLSV